MEKDRPNERLKRKHRVHLAKAARLHLLQEVKDQRAHYRPEHILCRLRSVGGQGADLKEEGTQDPDAALARGIESAIDGPGDLWHHHTWLFAAPLVEQLCHG